MTFQLSKIILDMPWVLVTLIAIHVHQSKLARYRYLDQGILSQVYRVDERVLGWLPLWSLAAWPSSSLATRRWGLLEGCELAQEKPRNEVMILGLVFCGSYHHEFGSLHSKREGERECVYGWGIAAMQYVYEPQAPRCERRLLLHVIALRSMCSIHWSLSDSPICLAASRRCEHTVADVASPCIL